MEGVGDYERGRGDRRKMDAVTLKSFRPLNGVVNHGFNSEFSVIGNENVRYGGGMEMEEEVAAIVVRGAEKSYTKGQKILDGLNMTVPCGSIYALLGSSGCGKSTLLSSLIGIRKLDRGSIYLFGVEAGTKASRSIGIPGKRIGYMPQDISLYSEFTISEMLRYFGTLCGLSLEQVEISRKFLIDMLELPDGSRRVGSLSGGQQRRVSFAAALQHEPKLIILDEPTVGVDPILRQKIWSYLRDLIALKRTTIVITTHYIEEARAARMIGVMRDGVLLAEKSPEQLLSSCSALSLEEAVLNLCKKKNKDDNDSSYSTNERFEDICSVASNKTSFATNIMRTNAHKRSYKLNANNENQGKGIPRVIRCVDYPIHMSELQIIHENPVKGSINRISALVFKNMTVLLRNLLLLSFVSWVPAVQLSFACLGYGHDPRDVLMGVVNNELDFNGNPSNCSYFNESESNSGQCDLTLLSCRYLRSLPEHSMKLIDFSSEEDAIDAVHNGDVWGYITFQKDFSGSFYERAVLGSDAGDDVLNISSINVRLDQTNKPVALVLGRKLFDGLQTFAKGLLFDCGYDPKKVDHPLDFKDPIIGRVGLEMQAFVAVSVGMAAIFFFPIVIAGIRFFHEKQCGMLERSMVSGVYIWELILAYSITEFLVLFVQVFFNYVVLVYIFKIYNDGSTILAFLLLYLVGYMGVSMGLFLGSVCREKIEIAILAMAFFLPNTVLSGIYWPVEGMPEIMHYIAWVLPCTLPTEALRSVFNRGWGFFHPNVWPGAVVPLVYIVCFNAFTVIYHRSINK